MPWYNEFIEEEEMNLKIYDCGSVCFDRYTILLMNRPIDRCYEAILCGDKPNQWITGDILYDMEELGTEIEFEYLPKWAQERLQEISSYL